MPSSSPNISDLLESIANVIIYCSDTKNKAIKPSGFISDIDTYIANCISGYIFPDAKNSLLKPSDLSLVKYYLLIIKNLKPLVDSLKLRKWDRRETEYIEVTLSQFFDTLTKLYNQQNRTFIINFHTINHEEIQLHFELNGGSFIQDSYTNILRHYTVVKLLLDNSQAGNALEKTVKPDNLSMGGEMKQESNSAPQQQIPNLGQEVRALEKQILKLQESLSAMTIMLADIQTRVGNIENNMPSKLMEDATIETRKKKSPVSSLFS